jgi:hypothetical protein
MVQALTLHLFARLYISHCLPLLLQDECEDMTEVTDGNANYNDNGSDGIEEAEDKMKIELNEEQGSLDIDTDDKYDENDS